MHNSIKSISGLCSSVALALTLSPIANADLSATKMSRSHLASAIPPSQKAAAHCVQAIQKHWSNQAKLVLDKRARLRETDTQKILLVDGWVWEQGQRVQKHHQCTTNKATQQFALRIDSTEQPLLAGK